MIRPQTQYYARVKALTASAESDYSNTVAITTLSSTLVNPPVAGASTPLIRTVKAGKYTGCVYVEVPLAAEQVLEYKLSVSTVSDFSSFVINNAAYPVSDLPAITEQGIQYYVVAVAGLVPNTTYYVRLQASNSVALSGIATTSIVLNTVLDKPVALGATSLSSINAQLSWTAVTSAVSYRLDVSTVPSFSTLVVSNLTVATTSHLVQSLIENTVYYYRVRAFDGTNLSSNSDASSFATLNGTATYTGQAFNLDAPVISSTVEALPNRIQLRWKAVLNASSYLIQMSTSNTFTSYTVNTSITTTDYIFTGLVAGTVYFIRVFAQHAGIQSPPSSRTITTPNIDGALTAPSLITPAVNYSTKAVLGWVKRTYASNYLLEISLVSTFATVVQSFYLKDSDSYEVTSLQPSTQYYARITGVNPTSVSPVSAFISFTTSSVLPVLTGLTSTVQDTSVVVKWNPLNIYVKYLVSIYTRASDGALAILHPSLFYRRDVGSATQLTIDVLLKPETEYKWLVEGQTLTGETYTSGLQSFTTTSRSPVLQLNTSKGRIEWAGQLNRLTVALDKQFRTCIPGWIDRQISTASVTSRAFDIQRLLRDVPGLFIKGRYVNGLTQSSFSNSVYTSGIVPVINTITVTNTSALIKWQECIDVTYGIRIEYESSPNVYVPVIGYSSLVDIGFSNEANLSSLLVDTRYRLHLYYKQSGSFVYLGVPVEFKTNKYTDGFSSNAGPGNTLPILTLSDVSHDRILISVTNPDSNSLSAPRLSRSGTTGTVYEQYSEIPSGIASIEFPVEANSPYIVTAVAINKTNNTRSAIASLSTVSANISYVPASLSTAPILSSLVILNNTEARINYSSVSNSSSYRVEVSTSSSFAFLDYDVTTYLYASTVLLAGLLPTNVYYVRMIAINEYGSSNYSNTVIVDTTP